MRIFVLFSLILVLLTPGGAVGQPASAPGDKPRPQRERGASPFLDPVPPHAARIAAAHLTMAVWPTERTVAPGARVSLVLDVTPAPKIHVYGPEQTEYIPLTLTLDPQPLLTYAAPRFPPTEEYYFEPLDERVQVYKGRFRIVQDVTVSATTEARRRAASEGTTLSIAGVLRYQACDDTFCFMPEDVPVHWRVTLTR
jgi:hypothetical protein